MKSIITYKEVKNYYARTFLLLPFIQAIIFGAVLFLVYLGIYSLLGLLVVVNYTTLYIGLILGFVEGLSTVIVYASLNKKKNTYYSNLERKGKTDFFIPVIFHQGALQNFHGVLIISKENVEYRLYQLFDKSLRFTYPTNEVKLEIVRRKKNILKTILTLSAYENILVLTTKDGKYEFIIPCLKDATHRLETHKVLV